MSIVYAVTSKKYNLKGVLINAFGLMPIQARLLLNAKLHHNNVSANLKGEGQACRVGPLCV